MEISAEDFVRWRYELCINQTMLSIGYILPIEDVRHYVYAVLNISLNNIIEFLIHDDNLGINSGDIFQFSSVADFTWRLCEKLIKAGDPVLTSEKLGELLLGNNPRRNIVAYRKYGENHGKMAACLGLVQVVERSYLLSALGCVFPTFSIAERERLIVRLLLRTPLISCLLRSKDQKINLRNVLCVLSDSTYLRRSSNIRSMLTLLSNSKEYNFKSFIDRICF